MMMSRFGDGWRPGGYAMGHSGHSMGAASALPTGVPAVDAPAVRMIVGGGAALAAIILMMETDQKWLALGLFGFGAVAFFTGFAAVTG